MSEPQVNHITPLFDDGDIGDKSPLATAARLLQADYNSSEAWSALFAVRMRLFNQAERVRKLEEASIAMLTAYEQGTPQDRFAALCILAAAVKEQP